MDKLKKGKKHIIQHPQKFTDDLKIQQKQEKKLKLKKIKTFFILLFILIIILAIKTGISVSRWQNLAQDMISNTPSQVLDTDGNIIAEIGNNKNTKNIKLSEIPDNLKNAYISIEDQRFYKHSGVDLPRTTAAIFSYIKNLGSSSFGGSSITQQLVKNLTGDNSSKITRKLNEWIKAFALEGVLSKDEILEAYLNVIYVGPNIYGVDLGAKYYFNKTASELTLVESAFLAGINNSPNSYNPFGDKDNYEKINKRTKTVLGKMLELKYITESQYNEAISQIDKGLKFKNGKINSKENDSIYSYHTDALILEITADIAKKKHISDKFATNYINMAGLKIYSTQNSNIQKEIENEVSKNKYILKSQKDNSVTSQTAMVIMDHKTGYVVGCVGGIGKKDTSRGFNRATQALRQTGSAGKPLSVLVPGLEEKIFTPATIYLDEETKFDDGTTEGYSPTNYNKYKGSITVRQAVESSQNIPFVKMMEQITPKTSIKYMKKMGITTLTKTDENLNLALGGLDKGISPLEMAAAYSCIANNGVYIQPTFYTKIENPIGKTVVKTKQNKRRAISKEVAYIVQNLLTEPVTGADGTANYCAISGIDVAAKTGTTNEEYDRWLCGFTPYYTAVTWFGFDLNETINFNRKNPSGQIWANVMKNIHSGLDKAKFEKPLKVETATICLETGLLYNSSCQHYYTEYFIKESIPISHCTKHKNNNYTPNETPSNTNIENQETKSDNSQKLFNQTPIKNSENQNITSELNTNTSNSSLPDISISENTVSSDSNVENEEINSENNTDISDTNSSITDSNDIVTDNIDSNTQADIEFEQ